MKFHHTRHGAEDRREVCMQAAKNKSQLRNKSSALVSLHFQLRESVNHCFVKWEEKTLGRDKDAYLKMYSDLTPKVFSVAFQHSPFGFDNFALKKKKK